MAISVRLPELYRHHQDIVRPKDKIKQLDTKLPQAKQSWPWPRAWGLQLAGLPAPGGSGLGCTVGPEPWLRARGPLAVCPDKGFVANKLSGFQGFSCLNEDTDKSQTASR